MVSSAAACDASIVRSHYNEFVKVASLPASKCAILVLKNGKDSYICSSTQGEISPVCKLFLSGLYTKNFKEIYTNYNLTDADKGIIKLCSEISDTDLCNIFSKDAFNDNVYDYYSRYYHRVIIDDYFTDLIRNEFPIFTGQGPGVDITKENPSTGKDTHDGFHTIHRLYMAAAYRLLRAKQGTNSRQGVASLLVSSTGKILGWGLKSPDHPALHGEVTAIMGNGGIIPGNARIYSTLKPCAMCAGFVTTLSGGSHKVYYGQNDPTKAAQKTTLDVGNQSRLLVGKHKDGVKGIMIPISNTGIPSRISMQTMLDKSFNRSKIKSPIDFATSESARSLYESSDTDLDRKIAKYKGDTSKNANVWPVLAYLTKFLNANNVPTEKLDPP